MEETKKPRPGELSSDSPLFFSIFFSGLWGICVSSSRNKKARPFGAAAALQGGNSQRGVLRQVREMTRASWHGRGCGDGRGEGRRRPRRARPPPRNAQPCNETRDCANARPRRSANGGETPKLVGDLLDVSGSFSEGKPGLSRLSNQLMWRSCRRWCAVPLHRTKHLEEGPAD